MKSVARRVFFDNLSFEVCEEVYEPSDDSFLFAENLNVKEGAQVLDIGTGSGILAVIAAKQAGNVLAVDLNPFAVRCAKRNAQLNGVSAKVTFLQCELFDSIAETARFDVILFNSPYLPSDASEAESWLGRAWAGGACGRMVIDRFIKQAPAHLEKGGEIFLMQSTLSGVEATVEAFRQQELKADVAAQRKLPFFETLVLIRAKFVAF